MELEDLTSIFSSDIWLNRFKTESTKQSSFAMAARSCKSESDRLEFQDQALKLIEEHDFNLNI
jgi:hypothetical protein